MKQPPEHTNWLFKITTRRSKARIKQKKHVKEKAKTQKERVTKPKVITSKNFKNSGI